MKSTKSQIFLPAEPEQCGVWLDAAELRAKKQQKMALPISKLLNPVARSGGYSMAVSLNFTQTKMHMPATKQSTISSFFVPQSKNSKDTKHCSSIPFISSTPLSEAQMGTKQEQAMTFELPSESDNISNHTCQGDPQDFSADVEKTEEISDDGRKQQQFLRLIWGYKSEQREQAEKRNPCEEFKSEYGTQTQKDSGKAISHGYKTSAETLLYKNNHKKDEENRENSLARCSAESFYHQELFKASLRAEKSPLFHRPVLTTVNQHRMKHTVKSYKGFECSEQSHQPLPVKKKNKENSRPTLSTHRIELSPLKWQQLPNGPAKLSSGKTHKKLTRQAAENEKNSFAMLFTQDSEGFRVIANRRQSSICPLKNQTTSSKGQDYWNTPSVTSMETENSDQEPEMLFTQDSQGNIVIKH